MQKQKMHYTLHVSVIGLLPAQASCSNTQGMYVCMRMLYSLKADTYMMLGLPTEIYYKGDMQISMERG